jgi:hypothetical protein
MGTITPVITRVDKARAAYSVLWETLTTADTGSAVSLPDGNDKSIQISGTWGGATAVVQGSNDNVTFITLADPQGIALSKTADFIEAILEHTRYLKVVTSGGAGTDLDATLFVKGQTT